MSINSALAEMSVEEKIRIMEAIWEDLCNRADSLASPAWHKEILAQREAAIERGEEQFVDWQTAKRDMKNVCR